jgi:aminoglycoside 3-N-acetyltransferase
MSQEELICFLADKWKQSGVNKGDILLVHSSLKRVLKKVFTEHNIKATPEMVYNSLIESVGDEGTLILPLFNFDFPKTKFFNINESPSHMGALTEVARNDPKSVRTGHPIYSFAVRGKHADKFKDVDNYSGYDSNSPFALIHHLNGKIASIGLSDQNSMTSYHYVEECNLVPYRYFKEFEGEYIDDKGIRSKKTYALFVRRIEEGISTDVDRAMNLLWEKGLYKGSQYDEDYGMRTILFTDFFKEIDTIIKEGNAINYLYSLEK